MLCKKFFISLVAAILFFSSTCAASNIKVIDAEYVVPCGWWLTAPKVEETNIGILLAQAGFVVASVDYRTIGTANYIDSVGDAKAAIRYLRAHADDFNIDKNKIAVMGMSASGYLAAMVGVTSDINKFNFGDNLNERVDVQKHFAFPYHARQRG